MDFIVISFYTNDWIYPQYADKLRDDCVRLGLRHHIVERPSTNRYLGNCQIKPFFVQECMESFKSPVMWMDVDGSILLRPEMLFEDHNAHYDLIGNRPVDNQDRIHVGSMLLNYTDPMRKFIEIWCESILRKDPLDDAAFNGTWDHFKNTIKFRDLPAQYFHIQKNPHDRPPADTVIMHRLSKSELKQRYKAGER